MFPSISFKCLCVALFLSSFILCLALNKASRYFCLSISFRFICSRSLVISNYSILDGLFALIVVAECRHSKLSKSHAKTNTNRHEEPNHFTTKKRNESADHLIWTMWKSVVKLTFILNTSHIRFNKYILYIHTRKTFAADDKWQNENKSFKQHNRVRFEKRDGLFIFLFFRFILFGSFVLLPFIRRQRRTAAYGNEKIAGARAKERA